MRDLEKTENRRDGQESIVNLTGLEMELSEGPPEKEVLDDKSVCFRTATNRTLNIPDLNKFATFFQDSPKEGSLDGSQKKILISCKKNAPGMLGTTPENLKISILIKSIGSATSD